MIEDKDIAITPSIIAARFDYIAPEYITLYITDSGVHTPAYIYRLFNELYLKHVWSFYAKINKIFN